MGVVAPIIGGVIGAGGAYATAKKQSKAQKQAIESIPRPIYFYDIDKIVADIIRQQAQLQPPDWTQYQNIVNQLLTSALPTSEYKQYLNQMLTGAFRPETDPTYQYYLNKLLENVRSGLTQRGLGTTGYGQGLEQQALTEYTMQNYLNQLARQQTALQNYLAGLSGMATTTWGALAPALKLEELRQGWTTPIAELGLSYMGMGVQPGIARASLLSQFGQTAGQEWAQLGSALSDIFKLKTSTGGGGFEKYPIGTYPPLSSTVYMPGTLSLW
jgi:hypothetical protein